MRTFSAENENSLGDCERNQIGVHKWFQRSAWFRTSPPEKFRLQSREKHEKTTSSLQLEGDSLRQLDRNHCSRIFLMKSELKQGGDENHCLRREVRADSSKVNPEMDRDTIYCGGETFKYEERINLNVDLFLDLRRCVTLRRRLSSLRIPILQPQQ